MNKKHNISFLQWLMAAAALLIVPLFAGMAASTEYTGEAVSRQLYIGNQNLAAVYMEKLDESLAGLDRFLRAFPEQNIDLSVLAMSEDATQRYVSKAALLAELNKNTLVYSGTADGMFILSQGSEEVFLSSSGDGEVFREVARGRLSGSQAVSSTGWRWLRVGESNYLLNTVINGSNCVGAWICMENLINPLEKIDLGENGAIFITAQDGTTLFPADDSQKSASWEEDHLRISQESKVSDVVVQVLIPKKTVSDVVFPIQLFIAGVFGVILLLTFLVVSLFERHVRWPITLVTDAMHKMRQGDFSVRIPEEASIREVQNVSESFNAMSRQIETLTRDVYERTIQEQKIRLQYLQLQIKPHFFLNTLNLIYSFAQIGRMDLIQKLTLSMVEYFRYNFSSTSDLVPLRGELRHVKNYLEIQQMRFPGAFRYQEEVDPPLMDMLVPPLILQTFVENCIKYAMDDEQECQVELRVTHDPQRTGFVQISVSDNGEGYPAEILEKFEKRLPLSEDKNRGIGIWNAYRRLKLLYGDDAEVALKNLPGGGAQSVLTLPEAQPGKQEDVPCILY